MGLDPSEAYSLNEDELTEILELFCVLREFDDTAIELHDEDEIVKHHSPRGHEAIGIATFYGLEQDDLTQAHYRTSFAQALCNDVGVEDLMKGAFVKRDWITKGKRYYLSPQPVDNNIFKSALMGPGIATTVGAGMTAQWNGENQVAVCTFGDGTSQEGYFWESQIFAELWDLPVVFICENNQIAHETPISEMYPYENISDGIDMMPTEVVDGTDFFEMYETVQNAVEECRQGNGPRFIEAKTYRLRAQGEMYPEPREEGEVESLAEKHDPVERYKSIMLDQEIVSQDELTEIESWSEDVVAEGIEAAKNSADATLEDVMSHVY